MQTELGDFIRHHRERITPASVGLPAGGRRRTPGLRREELAQLCDVSPTWLTWLEQGREVSASARLLARMAEVLQLSAAERAYLFTMADRLDPQQHDDGVEAAPTLAATLAAAVNAFEAPAYVLDRQWDALAWNSHALALFGGWLDVSEPDPQAPAAIPGKEGKDGRDGKQGKADEDGKHDKQASQAPRPNLLHFMFRSPAARGLIVDWPDRAARLVAEFRADLGKHAGEPGPAALIAELARDSAEFAALWSSQDVLGREGGLRRFHHPAMGELAFNQLTLHPAGHQEYKLVMLLP